MGCTLQVAPNGPGTGLPNKFGLFLSSGSVGRRPSGLCLKGVGGPHALQLLTGDGHFCPFLRKPQVKLHPCLSQQSLTLGRMDRREIKPLCTPGCEELDKSSKYEQQQEAGFLFAMA